MKNKQATRAILPLLLALLLFAGCGETPPPEPATTPTPTAAHATPSPEWQEEALDNPIDDWFDDGVFEGAPTTAAVYEKAYGALPLVSENGLAVSLEAVRYIENHALVFALRVQNNTEHDLVLSVSEAAVNGWMLDAMLTPLSAFSAGESATCMLEFSELTLSSFRHMQIHAIESLAFQLTVTEREGAAFGAFSVRADDLEQDAAAQAYDDAGTELLFGDVRAVYTGFDEEGYMMLFFAENTTEETCTLAITPYYNETVEGAVCERAIAPHCRAVLYLLPLETLYANGQQELFFASVKITVDGGAPTTVELF